MLITTGGAGAASFAESVAMLASWHRSPAATTTNHLGRQGPHR
jgi:hypothetical protein